MISIIILFVTALLMIYLVGRNVGVTKTANKIGDALPYGEKAKIDEDYKPKEGIWFAYLMFAFWFAAMSITLMFDNRSDIINDYNDGLYKVTKTERFEIVGNDTISCDTTYYYKKIKK